MSFTHHVFPYDPRHLGQTEESWIESQIQRWPLASVVRTAHPEEAHIHFIGTKPFDRTVQGVTFHCHASRLSGPKWWDWGDDWSAGLESAILGIAPDDLCVLHLDSYWAAMRAHWCARHCRVAVIQHGKGFPGAHIRKADAVVTLRAEATEALAADGYPSDRLIENVPSINCDLFRRCERQPSAALRMGIVGVVSNLKGTAQLVETADALRAANIPFTLDIVGTGPEEDVARLKRDMTGHATVEFRGHRAVSEIARMMADWDLLLHPSFSEGMSIAILEAMATGLPVVGVAGVHSPIMLRQSGFYAPNREEYARFIVENHPRIAASGCNSSLPTDHREGAKLWEDLKDITRLNAMPLCPRGADRYWRLKPLRSFIAGKSGMRGLVRSVRSKLGTWSGLPESSAVRAAKNSVSE